MNLEQTKLNLSFKEAGVIFIMIIFILGGGIIYLGLQPHLPLAAAVILLFIFGKCKKVPFSVMEKMLANGVAPGLGAIFIFLFIGMMISSWVASGTIPTLMYYGFSYISGTAFYVTVFLLTSLIGLCIGSSLTTAATIGVAFIGIGELMGASAAVTAGAIVSGAFLGDKMSPLSDTTNLASETVGVPIFEHIKNMMWTTVPGFIVSLALFYFLSPGESADQAGMKMMADVLKAETAVSIWSLIPFIAVGLLALRRMPAIPVLAAGTGSAVLIAFLIVPDLDIRQMGEILFSGYVLDGSNEQLNDILSMGGLESMLFSVSLVLLALGMGGLLFGLGIIPALLKSLASTLKTAGRLVTATAISGLGINLMIGEQYLSILITGKTFDKEYEKLGLEKKTLSRVMEDAGTLMNPLIPWGVCGVFLSEVLGVATLAYLPFAFFCLSGLFFTLLSGWTGIGLHYTVKKNK